ncbi:MAG: hypothetical protein PVF43_12315 [Candidatus Eiseniibacteriota bacterium]|jgi:hypothetical protein
MEIHHGRESVSWSAHPARERPAAAVLAGVAILALAVACARFGEHPLWGFLAVSCLFGALNRFFFPSHFSIDDSGITARHPLGRRQLRWQEIRRFTHDRYGGYLSTRARPSRLDAFAGVHLLFAGLPAARRRSIVERIDARLEDRIEGQVRTAPRAAVEELSVGEESATCGG